MKSIKQWNIKRVFSIMFVSGLNGAYAIDLWLSGNGSAARIYDEQLDEKLNQYLRNRLYYYTLETRWPDSCFWKRRSVINNLGDNY